MASPTGDCKNATVTGYPVQVVSGIPRREGGTDRRAINVICGIIVLLFVLFIISPYVFPSPETPEFRVDSPVFSPLNATGSELTATWDLTFRVRNPDRKFSANYERLEASILHGRHYFTLSTATCPPFFQPAKNETSVSATFRAVGEYVGDGLLSEIREGRGRGSVDFGVKVVAWVRFRSKRRRTKAVLKVYCQSVEFGFSLNNGNGTQKRPSMPCEVELD